MPTVLSVVVLFVAPFFYGYPHSRIFQKSQNLTFTTVQWYCSRVFLIVTRETIIENLAVFIFLLHGWSECKPAMSKNHHRYAGTTSITTRLQEKRQNNEVDCIVGGYDEINVVYIAYYDGNRRLSPCFENREKTVGYYACHRIRRRKHHRIIYNKNYNRIISEQYYFSNRHNVGYHCIIYVPNGKSLILGESEREYNADSLEYNPISNYVRCDK